MSTGIIRRCWSNGRRRSDQATASNSKSKPRRRTFNIQIHLNFTQKLLNPQGIELTFKIWIIAPEFFVCVKFAFNDSPTTPAPPARADDADRALSATTGVAPAAAASSFGYLSFPWKLGEKISLQKLPFSELNCEQISVLLYNLNHFYRKSLRLATQAQCS